MTTSVRSLAEQQKFARIFLCLRLIQSFSCFISRYGSTRLSYPYPHRLGFHFYSRQSIIYGSTRPRLSTFVPTHYASSSFFYSSFHLVCCFDILSTTVIVPRSWPSWVCRVSNAHGGFDVYPTLASIFFLGVPRIRCSWWVYRVPCSRVTVCVYLFRPVTSRPSSMFRSPSLSCFCNLSSPVILSCQSATVRLRPCLRPCQCLHGIAIVLLVLHQIPVVIR